MQGIKNIETGTIVRTVVLFVALLNQLLVAAGSNKSGAKIFVSIHLNAGGGTGYETLVYSQNKEASIIHAEIRKVLDKYNVKDRGIKNRPDLAVLKGTKATALLLEMAFIDNKADMDLLNNQTYLAQLCQVRAKLYQAKRRIQKWNIKKTQHLHHGLKKQNNG